MALKHILRPLRKTHPIAYLGWAIVSIPFLLLCLLVVAKAKEVRLNQQLARLILTDPAPAIGAIIARNTVVHRAGVRHTVYSGSSPTYSASASDLYEFSDRDGQKHFGNVTYALSMFDTMKSRDKWTTRVLVQYYRPDPNINMAATPRELKKQATPWVQFLSTYGLALLAAFVLYIWAILSKKPRIQKRMNRRKTTPS